MKIKVLKGTHFEVNKQISKYFKNKIKEINLGKIDNQKVQNIINLLENHYPSILQEIYGRASGLDINIENFIYLTSYELTEQAQDKCSDLYINNDNQTGIYHNEDGSDELKFFICNYDDETIFDLCCHSALHGTTFSATKDLMFSINYIYNSNYNLNADFPTWIFTRLILTCKNIKEVEEVLKKFSIWGSVSINLLDIKTNKLYSIEKHFKFYSIKKIKGIYFKTNTFIHEEMQKYSNLPENTNTSFTRYNKIKELLNTNNLTYEQIILYNNGDDYDSVRVTGQNRNNSKTQATVYFCSEKIEIIKNNKKQTYLIKDIFN